MKLKIAVLALVLTAAACGGDDDSASTETTAATTATTSEVTSSPETTEAAPETTAAEPIGATVALGSTGLGDVLVDGDGNTLYLFTPDSQGPSACYDGCAGAWPPLIGDVGAGDGVDGSLLGTTARDDGPDQVTYNGWPLYYFASDAAAGDVNGQGANDVWFVVSAAGDGIGVPEAEAAPAGQVVATASSDLGDILVDGDGNTLYLFVPDNQGASTCSGGCAGVWPPVVDAVTAGDGLDGSLLGTVARDDGSEQVTYNGWPLYYYASDGSPGDTNGQGANDVWYVVSPAGEAITG